MVTANESAVSSTSDVELSVGDVDDSNYDIEGNTKGSYQLNANFAHTLDQKSSKGRDKDNGSVSTKMLREK